MGADGPGKAEIATAELGRARLFCDDWEQASHGGELAAGVEAGIVARDDVTSSARCWPATPRAGGATTRSRCSTPPASRSRTSRSPARRCSSRSRWTSPGSS